MSNKKSIYQLLSQTYHFLATGQFLKLASKIFFYLRNQNKLMRRRKSLRDHGSTVFEQVMAVCQQTEIYPHLTFGSLLGYRRNNGLINGDDDLDFGLLSSDKPNIPNFIAAMGNSGFLLKAEHHLQGPLSIIGDYCEITFTHRKTDVAIDFYFHHPWLNEEIIFAGDQKIIGYFHESLLQYTPVEKSRLLGYALSYPGNLAKKFVSTQFLGCEVRVPAETDAYLKQIYGDWVIPQKKFFYKNVSAVLAKNFHPGIELIRLPAPSLMLHPT